MYKICDECPCFQIKNKAGFCFYYQSYTDSPCGNHFLEKPKYTQEELEEIAFGDIKKLKGDKLKKRIEIDEYVKKWKEKK